MWSCDQTLVTLAFRWEKLSQTQFYKNLTRKAAIFDRWSWFKFNNLGLTLGANLKFYTSVAKGLKLKFRKFWGLTITFAEVTVEKLVIGPFSPPSPTSPILNRVKEMPSSYACGPVICKSLRKKTLTEKKNSLIRN